MAKSVADQIDEQIRMVEARMEAMHRGVARDLKEEVMRTRDQGGRMPKESGFLQASVQSSTLGIPRVDPNARPEHGKTYQADDSDAVIDGLMPDQTYYVGVTAAYAQQAEGRNAFVEGAKLEAPRIIKENIEKAKREVPDAGR